MALSKLTLLALLPFFLATPSLAVSGTGVTTRYWDCCKPSCSWSGKASLKTGPVQSCDKNDNVLANVDAKSACDNGGPAFMCSNESPWAVSDSLAYGYAAVSIAGGTEASWCCACYELTFTSGPVSGKKMIVQATNTGGDLGQNHFDLGMPGGGFGIFNACTPQYGTPSTGWGAQYGGISSRSQCDAFPAALKAGCYWRFDWFQNADNPSVSFKSVACPLAITNKSGCVRSDDTPTGDGTVPTASVVTPVSSTSAGTTTPSSGTGTGGGTVANVKTPAVMSLSWPERSRQERRFLRDCCPNYWGFAIYRTVYTPESDLLWEGTIAKLDEYVINSIWRYMGVTNLEVEEGEDQLDPTPTREVCARYRNLIMSDREKYDGASIDEVADHFTDWADDPNNDKSSNINMNVCLLIDEEDLYWLRDAPPATTEVRTTGNADQNVCIKVIDTLFDPEDMSECDPRYRGWA
ncbi:hypothetical protein V499_06576, partial [Pseudogymnoascus sp. VKM F-103]